MHAIVFTIDSGGLRRFVFYHALDPREDKYAMKAPTKELLEQMQAVFPTLGWSADELDDLVTPSFGLITGFPELLAEIEKLVERDLGELPPAGILSPPKEF